jgi:rhodanese-related sulfurtransferase
MDEATPVGVFTGGSLIVGSAARPDLLGDDRTIELARAQYQSLHRLATLPDTVAVWPTHGAGSFCSSPPGAAWTSTIGTEKTSNPLLAAPDAETFTDQLLASLGSYPAYFRWLAEVNRTGPPVLTDEPRLPPLSAGTVRRLIADGALVVDVRPITDVAAGHIPGALSLALRDQFATWLGWLVAPTTDVIIVRNRDQDPADIIWPALTIGFDRLVGELDGGITAWTANGGALTTTPLVHPHEVDAPVLDIRQASEYAAGHLPRAAHLELGSLPSAPDAAPHGPTVLMCGHGERAMTAATLLERTGRRDLHVLLGGPDQWAAATGRPLKEGP